MENEPKVVKFPGKFVGAKKPSGSGKSKKDTKSPYQDIFEKYSGRIGEAVKNGEVVSFIGAMRLTDGSLEVFHTGFGPLESYGITKILDDITTESYMGYGDNDLEFSLDELIGDDSDDEDTTITD